MKGFYQKEFYYSVEKMEASTQASLHKTWKESSHFFVLQQRGAPHPLVRLTGGWALSKRNI